MDHVSNTGDYPPYIPPTPEGGSTGEILARLYRLEQGVQASTETVQSLRAENWRLKMAMRDFVRAYSEPTHGFQCNLVGLPWIEAMEAAVETFEDGQA